MLSTLLEEPAFAAAEVLAVGLDCCLLAGPVVKFAQELSGAQGSVAAAVWH